MAAAVYVRTNAIRGSGGFSSFSFLFSLSLSFLAFDGANGLVS